LGRFGGSQVDGWPFDIHVGGFDVPLIRFSNTFMQCTILVEISRDVMKAGRIITSEYQVHGKVKGYS
jgi:hypothetical protein